MDAATVISFFRTMSLLSHVTALKSFLLLRLVLSAVIVWIAISGWLFFILTTEELVRLRKL